MKVRLIAAIFLLVVSLGAAMICLLRVEKITKELIQAVDSARLVALETQALGDAHAETKRVQDWETATETVEMLWHRHSSFLHTLLPHVNLNELEWSLGALRPYLQQGDSMLYVEQCVRGLQCLRTVQEMECISLGNIF